MLKQIRSESRTSNNQFKWLHFNHGIITPFRIRDRIIPLSTDSGDETWKKVRAYIEKGEVLEDSDMLEVSGETDNGEKNDTDDKDEDETEVKIVYTRECLNGDVCDPDFETSFSKDRNEKSRDGNEIDIGSSTYSCDVEDNNPVVGVLEKIIIGWPLPFLQVRAYSLC